MVRTAALVALAAGAIATARSAPHAGTALVVAAPLRSPQAIVSLASHEWERLPVAAKLASAHPAALVVLTLPAMVTKFNCHDCAGRAEWLRKAGVDARRIRILPLTSSGTHGEALATRSFLVESGVRRIDVVTSPYHTRRSLATFETVLRGLGAEVGIVPASEASPARPERWWAAGYDLAYVRYEWTALVYYRLRYGVPVSRP